MKIKHIIAALSSLLIVVFGCETTEKIDDFPLRPSSMVVNCYFSDSSLWEFQVSKSLSVLDNADLKLIAKATVKLYADNELIADITSPDQDGWYRSDAVRPALGKEYRVEISSPDFDGSIEATAALPPTARITGTELIIRDSSFYEWTDYEGNLYQGGSMEGSFVIRFKDSAGFRNFYELSVLYMDTSRQYDHYDQYEVLQQKLWLTSEDAAVDYGADGSNNLLLSDVVFDGQEYQLKVDFNDWKASRQKKYYIVLSSWEQTGYLYKQTIAAYRDAVNDPFAEPVQIYSNVEKGYGIFAGYAVSVDSLQVN